MDGRRAAYFRSDLEAVDDGLWTSLPAALF